MSANPPDMVLLDIMMPDMDGYEVLRRIRQHTPTANIPVIFLTALATRQDERLGMDLGAVDYLTKPVDPELVVQRVEAHVRATAHARRIEAAVREARAAPGSRRTGSACSTAPTSRPSASSRRCRPCCTPRPASCAVWNDRERDSFTAEVEWLATRHHGTVDRFIDGAAVVFFDEPGPCVRMAMDLQRSANELHLRMGIHTGICDIGTFRSGHQACCTLIGPETGLAAQVAATAATGSIAVSPETYALVKDEIHADAAGCLADGGIPRQRPGAGVPDAGTRHRAARR